MSLKPTVYKNNYLARNSSPVEVGDPSLVDNGWFNSSMSIESPVHLNVNKTISQVPSIGSVWVANKVGGS